MDHMRQTPAFRSTVSAALRLVAMALAIVAFFLIGTPLQWVARRTPATADRIPRFFCRTLLWIAKVEVVVEGYIAERPMMIACNHISWIDILALGTVLPFCFLAKSEVAAWPLVSAFAKVQGTVFVDRTRRRSIVPANRELASRMLAGRAALLFPEGTTLAGPLPGPFLSSHFAALRDLLILAPGKSTTAVQPAAIAYSSDAAAWIGDDNLLQHLWRTLRDPPLTCRVRFGAPIPFGRSGDRKIVAATARAAVGALLGARPVEEFGLPCPADAPLGCPG